MIGSFLDDPKYLAPLDDSDGADNFEVLMSKDELEKKTKEIGEAIHHPVAIIDVNRIDIAESKNIQTNSFSEYFSLRYSCRLFRHCAGSEMCHKCDYDHAKQFKNFLIDFYKMSKEDRKLPYLTDFKNDRNEKLRIFQVKGFSRPVCEYYCNMLGYRELLIPLYFQTKLGKSSDSDKVLGIIFIGQSVVEKEKDVEYVKKTKEKFFLNNDLNTIFKDYPNPIVIKDWIINADEKFEEYENLIRMPSRGGVGYSEAVTMNFSDMGKYIEFIEGACKEIRNIETEIKRMSIEKKNLFFQDKGREIVSSYFGNIRQIKSRPEDPNNPRSDHFELEIAWSELSKEKSLLKKNFGFNQIHIFGDATNTTMIQNNKKIIYPEPTKESIYHNWKYDYGLLNSEELQNVWFYSSFDYPDVLNGLQIGKIDNQFMLVFSNFALLFCVDNLKNNEDTYRALNYAIGQQFIRIHSYIGLVTADFMHKKLITTLRMNRHENAHISTRLKDNLDVYFANKGQLYTRLSSEKQEHIVSDMQNTTKLLSHMSNTIGVITESINKDKLRGEIKRVNFNDLIYRWQSMFKDKIKKRNLNFEVIKDYSDSYSSSSSVTTVPYLFELMIYNLIDNAVKYAYRGTNVYFSWAKDSDERYNVFTAINYGPEIREEEKKRIFDLYIRGASTNKSRRVDGDGIGLYFVDKICELLHCKVEFTNNKVAESNLPLIEWYVDYFKDTQKEKSDILGKYYNDFDEKLKKSIINTKEETMITDKYISEEYLERRITNKIWKTVFTVKVPRDLRGE